MTTGDALALIAETQRRLGRAAAALEEAPAMGPKALGKLIGHVERIHDALGPEIIPMEQIVDELRR
jgi:hypothetical protein